MAWFNLFSGPSAERLEQKGDALGAAGYWGAAKLEYERAQRKLEAATVQDQVTLHRLEEKIAATREALARDHHRNASDLAAIGDFKEALELVELALALTGDDALKETLAQQRREIEATLTAERRQTLSAPEDEWDPEEDNADVLSPEEAFRALCGTLPDSVRRAYLGYGADFKTGYLALNNGDFETAADYLARAMEARNAADSYIPLELATAMPATQPARAGPTAAGDAAATPPGHLAGLSDLMRNLLGSRRLRPGRFTVGLDPRRVGDVSARICPQR